MNTNNSVDINGNKIRLLREQKELTQLYLATVVGVTTDTISRWENRRYPSIKPENARKLAEALGYSIEELLDDGPPEPEAAGSERSRLRRPRTDQCPGPRRRRCGRVCSLVTAGCCSPVCRCGRGRGRHFFLVGSRAAVRAERVLPPHRARGAFRWSSA